MGGWCTGKERWGPSAFEEAIRHSLVNCHQLAINTVLGHWHTAELRTAVDTGHRRMPRGMLGL